MADANILKPFVLAWDGGYVFQSTPLRSPKIKPKLFIVKGKNKGNPNYYFITAIVGILLENNVYNAKKYSLLDLSKILEQTNKKNNVYTSSQHYISYDLILTIRVLIK